MWAFLWLGLLAVLMMILVVMSKNVSGFDDYSDRMKTYGKLLKYEDRGAAYKQLLQDSITNYNKDPLTVNNTDVPNDYTVDIVRSTRIDQAPFPPCTGFVDEVVYAPSDTNADIAQIKADLAILQKNIPNYVTDGVNQQAPLLMKGLLRQQGFPLQDDQYGQNLACN